MEYRRDDERIRAFHVEDEIVCRDCIEDEELAEMNKSNILTDYEIGKCVICVPGVTGSCSEREAR